VLRGAEPPILVLMTTFDRGFETADGLIYGLVLADGVREWAAAESPCQRYI
jgi:hypothetical protein